MSAHLATLILRLAGEQDGRLVRGYTRQELADMLGAFRQTISETLDTLLTPFPEHASPEV